MFLVKQKKNLNSSTVMIKIEAPKIANKARPGQFVIIRADENSERLPLTIAGYDSQKGTVTVIFQTVGVSTMKLSEVPEGGYISDIVGPLGRASELDGIKKAVVIGGGLGCAIAYPQAKYLHENGASVDIIAGFRNRDVIILEDEMKAVCDNLTLLTDDG